MCSAMKDKKFETMENVRSNIVTVRNILWKKLFAYVPTVNTHQYLMVCRYLLHIVLIVVHKLY